MNLTAGGTAHECSECGMVTPVYEHGQHHDLACSQRPGTFKPVSALGNPHVKQARS